MSFLPIAGHAQDTSVPTRLIPGAEKSSRLPAEIGRLEQVLSQAQEEKDRGRLKTERYQEFLLQFRSSLEIAWSASARSAEDSATYARIIARLGDPAQALVVLGPALEQAPDDPDLRLTSGEVRFEQKDYPAALAEANAVLAKDPGNRRALGLKHFSKGRISGTSTNALAAPQSGPAESGSIWNDPRIVEAGRRAAGRRNAIHFMDQAMSRLKISDPREALRFLALAEVSDPASPDVPMQQGLAYMDLKAPGKALGRFSQAEAMWQAKGHANAGLARAMKARAADELAVKPSEAAPRQAPVQDPRRTTWPLAGVAAGFALAGAVTLLLKKDEIARARRAIDTGALIVAGGLAGGFLGYAAYAALVPALTGGGTLALAGGGTAATAAAVEGGAAAFTAVGGLAGGAAAAKAAVGSPEGQPKRETPPSGDPGQGPVPGPMPIPLPIPGGTDTRPRDCVLKPGENILTRFIDGTGLTQGFLLKHEGPGHTIRDHVNQKLEDLVRQIRAGKKDASSYPDMMIAEDITRRAIENNRTLVEAWFARRTQANQPTRYTGSHLRSIGYTISEQNPSVPIPKYDAVAVLQKNDDCRILILTSYPQ